MFQFLYLKTSRLKKHSAKGVCNSVARKTATCTVIFISRQFSSQFFFHFVLLLFTAFIKNAANHSPSQPCLPTWRGTVTIFSKSYLRARTILLLNSNYVYTRRIHNSAYNIALLRTTCGLFTFSFALNWNHRGFHSLSIQLIVSVRTQRCRARKAASQPQNFQLLEYYTRIHTV